MFCSKCGTKANDGDAFCSKCGAKLNSVGGGSSIAREGLEAWANKYQNANPLEKLAMSYVTGKAINKATDKLIENSILGKMGENLSKNPYHNNYKPYNK